MLQAEGPSLIKRKCLVAENNTNPEIKVCKSVPNWTAAMCQSRDCLLERGLYRLLWPLRYWINTCADLKVFELLPPKSRYAVPQYTVARSFGSFLRMMMRRPVPTKCLRRVSSTRAPVGHGPWQSWRGGPFVGTGRQGGTCRKWMSPIKRSYFFGTEKVHQWLKWVC